MGVEMISQLLWCILQESKGVTEMIVDRYYYHQLNKQEQVIYKAFYKGVMSHQEIIPIPVRGEFSQESFERIFMAMTRDNPLIYFLNQSACSTASDMFGRLAICPQYFFTKEKVKEYNRKIEKVVNELAGQMHLLECNDYEKELRVHDWICRNIEYDYEGADKDKVSRVIASHNILGVFAHHKAQCEGIAKAVKVLLNAVDVKCIVVTGDSIKSGQCVPHAWNIVDIGGEPYQLDVTWDIGTVKARKIIYDYFNLTDSLMNLEHRSENILPKCNKSSANYFVRAKCDFHTRYRLSKHIQKQIEQGKKEIFFRINGMLKKENIIDMVDAILRQNYQSTETTRGGFSYNSNEKIGVYYIRIN